MEWNAVDLDDAFFLLEEFLFSGTAVSLDAFNMEAESSASMNSEADTCIITGQSLNMFSIYKSVCALTVH